MVCHSGGLIRLKFLCIRQLTPFRVVTHNNSNGVCDLWEYLAFQHAEPIHG